MTDGRESAYPCNYELDSEGLTKRELFAAMAKKGAAMSEVKHELCVVYPATLGYETDYRPATTAEIMASHPKCGECRHCTTDGYHAPFCGSPRSPSRTMDVILSEDYCRHWEGKG